MAGIYPDTFNYEGRQLDRLEPSETYRIKITSDENETKWLTIDREQLAMIRTILTTGGGDR